MSRRSKLKEKMKAIKQLGDLPDKEARALAKNSRLVRLKKKRLVLRGPQKQIVGVFHLHDHTLHIQFANGVQFEQDGNHAFNIHLPEVEEPKKKKDKKKEEAIPPPA